MAILKRTVPTAIAAVVGVLILAAAFVSNPLLQAISTHLIDTTVILAAFALLLGLLNILHVHALKIRRRERGSPYSAVLIVAMLVVLTFGLLPYGSGPSGPSQPVVQWIFQSVQVPIQTTLSALMAFFVLTAAYRLLQARSWESTLMLIAALLVLVGQVTVGLLPVVPDIKDWVLDVLAMTGVRGVLLGVALGVILTGMRLLLGVERPYDD
jgi:type IV secretory pathway VirB2 component (pilin)